MRVSSIYVAYLIPYNDNKTNDSFATFIERKLIFHFSDNDRKMKPFLFSLTKLVLYIPWKRKYLKILYYSLTLILPLLQLH